MPCQHWPCLTQCCLESRKSRGAPDFQLAAGIHHRTIHVLHYTVRFILFPLVLFLCVLLFGSLYFTLPVLLVEEEVYSSSWLCACAFPSSFDSK